MTSALLPLADTLPEALATLGVLSLGAAAPLGFILYLDLLAPHVLLDYLRVFHNVLADSHLFLDHRALVHNDLFLGHGHHDLVLTDLGLRGLAFYGHPLHAYLLVAGRDLYVLAVCTNTLTDLQLTGLALAGACGELFLCPLHPALVLVFEVIATALVYTLIIGSVLAELASLGVAHGHARSNGSLIGVVRAVGTARIRSVSVLQSVVGVDFALELGSDLPVVVEGRTVLDRFLVLRDLDDLTLIVDPG